MNVNVFRFGEVADAQAVAVAIVPSGISTKGALFDAVSRGLSFPEYFGRNFDALEECLRDLAWLPRGRILIVHEGLPLLDSGSLGVYLSILKGAVEKWQRTSERELIVTFSAADEEAVAAKLG